MEFEYEQRQEEQAENTDGTAYTQSKSHLNTEKETPLQHSSELEVLRSYEERLVETLPVQNKSGRRLGPKDIPTWSNVRSSCTI